MTVASAPDCLLRTSRRCGWVVLPVALFLFAAPALGQTDAEQPGRLIGATATVTEVSTGLPFDARVDTGATSCSIHYEKMKIEDASDDPDENVGKPVKFLVKNQEGETQWIEAKIVGHVVVRTSEKSDDRYKVRLKLRCEDVEKKVLVTLNDRQAMNYPLLLGRNFLSGDFLVNVAQDNGD